MLKRVGILTLYAGSCNYGGVLQAYGLCALVAQEGGTPRQILYRKTKTPGSRLRALCKKNPKRILLRAGQQVQTKVCDRLYHVERDMANRRGAFDAFKKAYIPDSGRVYHPDTIPEAVPEYDLFICGSDQVWNPNVVDDAYFLRFVPEGKGKIAYAVSIAAPIPEAMKNRYAEAMAHLDGVSVREERAVSQLADLSPVPARWVLDPVLMLSREDWEAVAAPKETREKYLLCYFLGHDRAYRRLAERYAREKGLKIVSLPYVSKVHPLSDQRFGDERLFDVGPDRFLGLLRDAECVMTDSFHASALCHIYEKPFWALRRTTQHADEGRVEGLLRATGLEDRFLRNCGSGTAEKIAAEKAPDFSQTRKFLKEMREISLDYLRKYL